MNESPSIRMKVTRELLERYESCKEGLEWFDAHYPEGEELITMLTSAPLPPPDFVAWGLKYFNVSDEERTAANLMININTSTRVFGSYEVEESDFVVSSHDVKSSHHVLNSTNILNSNDIKYSNHIITSDHIVSSSAVRGSQYISNSRDIQSSANVDSSNSISWSEVIKNSLNIEDGIYCSLCKDSSLLSICEMVTNCSNCCVCFGIDGKENYLFNEPSTIERIEEVRTNIMNLMGDRKELNLASTSLSKFFEIVPAAIIEYLKSLPEYREVIGASFNSIFM